MCDHSASAASRPWHEGFVLSQRPSSRGHRMRVLFYLNDLVVMARSREWADVPHSPIDLTTNQVGGLRSIGRRAVPFLTSKWGIWGFCSMQPPPRARGTPPSRARCTPHREGGQATCHSVRGQTYVVRGRESRASFRYIGLYSIQAIATGGQGACSCHNQGVCSSHLVMRDLAADQSLANRL